jgi:NAD(P)-dependent dehydrogenase (short-subunit alcohol dehydrogenase family)
MTSTDTKTWLITGAGRGMGADFARAALAAGHNVVATGRNLADAHRELSCRPTSPTTTSA